MHSWDITKLRGPLRGVWYDLYVMLDIFSRYAVGWRVEQTETAELATEFIDDVIRTYGKPQAVHADRGTSMTSKSVAQLLVDLDVARSHSRPHVSNDNPYSEAAFKTLKYCPAFADHFDDIDHARAFCKEFFDYYNHEHYHSGLGLHTPHQSTSEQPSRSAPPQTIGHGCAGWPHKIEITCDHLAARSARGRRRK
jgi:putative transposase